VGVLVTGFGAATTRVLDRFSHRLGCVTFLDPGEPQPVEGNGHGCSDINQHRDPQVDESKRA
jgi:hypothetical protein